MKIIDLISIEGNIQWLDGGAMFGNAPRELWMRWVQTDSKNRIKLACRALLMILDDGRHILFETGIGSFFSPRYKERYGVVESEHMLLVNLKKYGLSDEDIDIVVLSHLHFDHAGGLLDTWNEHSPRKLLFPNAEFWIGTEQWNRANNPHLRDRASYIPELQELLKSTERLRLINERTQHPLAPLLFFTFSQGHTPGLMLSHINSSKGPVVFCSDLIPGSAWTHIPITMGYDRFPEKICDEKEQLLDILYKQKGYLFFTHDNSIPLGKVTQDDKGKYKIIQHNLKNLI